MDAGVTNSLTNATKQAASPKVNTSFASVIKSNQNNVVQITELRNEEHVEGAAVTIPLSAIKESWAYAYARHSLAIIRIEYEWTPPSKSYLEEWPDDDFEVVKKIDKKKKHQKQVDGVVLNKPSLTLHYRRVDRGNSTKQSGSYVASTSKEGGKSAATSTQSKNVRLENSFSALNDDEIIMKRINTTWHLSQHLEC
ncbi:hypothetical protein Tco_1393899 [Tanacetum coccineum]